MSGRTGSSSRRARAWDKASQYWSYGTGFSGTTSNTRFTGTADLQLPMQVSYDYTRKDYGDAVTQQIVALFPAVTVLSNADATKEPEHDLQLGAPRKDVAVSRIRIPAGWHVDLPDAVHAKSDWVEFDKTYRFTDGEIVAERSVTVLQTRVPRDHWKEYQAFCKEAELGQERMATLLPGKAFVANKDAAAAAAKVGKEEHGVATAVAPGGGVPVPEASKDADAAELKRTAGTQLQAGEVSAARATIERLRAKFPDEPGLHAMLGSIAQMNGKNDEALVEFQTEAAKHPEMPGMALLVASIQERQGKSAEARETLQHAFQKRPGDLQTGFMLAANQTQAEQYAAAAETFQAVVDQNPANVAAKVGLGNALLAAGRRDEAGAVAKAALEGSDDPGILNDAGYLLAEAGTDLPEAETVSRRSIETLEQKSRAITPEEVNSRTFGESNMLVAAWDTLGWILFREGKVEEAEPYLAASWRNSLHPEVGDHVGKVLEKRGSADAAAAQYRAAMASVEGNNASPLVKKTIAADVARTAGQKMAPSAAATQQIRDLEKTTSLSAAQKQQMIEQIKARSEAGTDATASLQEMRTYRIARPKGAKGWGTVRLQLSNRGVQAVDLSSGDASLKSTLDALRQVKFDGLVPPSSQAYLLRSGVLSCSQSERCELVLVPFGSLQTERQQ